MDGDFRRTHEQSSHVLTSASQATPQTTAGSAAQALELLAKQDHQLIVSDIGMPEMDGYDFIREVRALQGDTAKIPAIALTAFARTEDRTRSLLAGYQIHISKPVDSAELIAAVAALAGRAGHAARE